MNENNPRGTGPRTPMQPQTFQQVDADAVCEQCGTVNNEGSLMCAVCGQNLRDQRARRLAGAKTGEIVEPRVNRVRLLTGLLSLFGILIVVFAVLNLGNIEAGLVGVLSEEAPVGTAAGQLWSGPAATAFEELASELRDYPTPRTTMQAALDDPVSDTTYNGRYILLTAGPLDAGRVLGEAILQRRGNRVNFVALIRRPSLEIRGIATMESITDEQTGELVERPVVRSTAGYISEDGEKILGYGLSEPQDGGGHHVWAMVSGEGAEDRDKQTEVFAYRIR